MLMLKRRRRIAKYINALKRKKRALSNADVQRLKLEENEGSEGEADQRIQQAKQAASIPTVLSFTHNQTQDEQLWHDSDEELPLGITPRNMFKKLQLQVEPSQQQYEERLRSFYRNKYGLRNWAVQGDGQQEEDITDILNHEQIYAQGRSSKEPYSVSFFGRSTEKHASVVTGADFRNTVVASCGLDQKLKLWKVNSDESNPELKVKLEKDVYTEGYSLTGCFFRGTEVVLGTLRQNYLTVDCQKWKVKYLGSSFLNDHPRFQHLRHSPRRDSLLIFSNNKISIVDGSNTYQGSLLASQPLVDAQFAQDHYVLGISNDVTYLWDLRTWRLLESSRECLGNTKLWTNQDTVAVGSKLGIVRLGSLSQGLKQYAQIANLVTHVTTLEGSHQGDLLLEASKWKSNAVRFIDTASGRCVGGFPTSATKVGLPTAAAFSSGKEVCIANSHGYLNFFTVGRA